MRVSRIFNSLIGSFIVVNLLPYVLVVTAFRLDFLTYNLPYHLFQRSLPGLLITAPAGAVGYQPPPGPVPNNALPIETGAVAEKGPQGLSQESTQESAKVDGTPPLTAKPQKNAAILTGTATKTQAAMDAIQTATAGRDIAVTSTGLFLSVFLTVLQL